MRAPHGLSASLGTLVVLGALASACADSGGLTLIYMGVGVDSARADPECSGDPSEININEACGIFVQADAPGPMEDGTQIRPYKSLQKALDRAGSKRVYACGSAPFEEAVTIAAPLALYGGFECANGWTWKPDARSALHGPPDEMVLTLTQYADGVRVQGFSIQAANAARPGGSSIAVGVADIQATFVSCDVTAGTGRDGANGVWVPEKAQAGTDALWNQWSMDACINAASVVGGLPGITDCDDGVTAGGQGGKGGTGVMGGDEAPGTDGALSDAIHGKGGSGPTAKDCCTDGTDGKKGTNGSSGEGGHLPGELSLAGLHDTDMTDGKPGTRGGGGGGGGGTKSGMFCADPFTDGVGASGGGGGAGGCGGQGGAGGKAGGSSLAILSLGTKLSLMEVSLQTGKGGNGGKGVGPQSPGFGGRGARGGDASGIAGSCYGCSGGYGGSGGGGGPGGGGRGGHSIGIAYANGPSNAPALTGFTGAAMGAGGAPGPGNPTGMGAKGAMGACWDFSIHQACIL